MGCTSHLLLILLLAVHLVRLQALDKLGHLVRNNRNPREPRDEDHRNRFNGYPRASLEYFPLQCSENGDRRAMGLCANITRDVVMARIGSRPTQSYEPPGFDIVNKHCAERGHLLGNQLGGTGKDVRNIVSLYHRANNPLMKQWEDMAALVLRGAVLPWDGQAHQRPISFLEYKVEVEYGTGDRAHPTFIHMTVHIWFADGSRELWFDVRIPNEYNAERRDIDVRRDNSVILFRASLFDPSRIVRETKGQRAIQTKRTERTKGRALITKGPVIGILTCLCSTFFTRS